MEVKESEYEFSGEVRAGLHHLQLEKEKCGLLVNVWYLERWLIGLCREFEGRKYEFGGGKCESGGGKYEIGGKYEFGGGKCESGGGKCEFGGGEGDGRDEIGGEGACVFGKGYGMSDFDGRGLEMSISDANAPKGNGSQLWVPLLKGKGRSKRVKRRRVGKRAYQVEKMVRVKGDDNGSNLVTDRYSTTHETASTSGSGACVCDYDVTARKSTISKERQDCVGSWAADDRNLKGTERELVTCDINCLAAERLVVKVSSGTATGLDKTSESDSDKSGKYKIIDDCNTNKAINMLESSGNAELGNRSRGYSDGSGNDSTVKVENNNLSTNGLNGVASSGCDLEELSRSTGTDDDCGCTVPCCSNLDDRQSEEEEAMVGRRRPSNKELLEGKVRSGLSEGRVGAKASRKVKGVARTTTDGTSILGDRVTMDENKLNGVSKPGDPSKRSRRSEVTGQYVTNSRLRSWYEGGRSRRYDLSVKSGVAGENGILGMFPRLELIGRQAGINGDRPTARGQGVEPTSSNTVVRGSANTSAARDPSGTGNSNDDDTGNNDPAGENVNIGGAASAWRWPRGRMALSMELRGMEWLKPTCVGYDLERPEEICGAALRVKGMPVNEFEFVTTGEDTAKFVKNLFEIEGSDVDESCMKRMEFEQRATPAGEVTPRLWFGPPQENALRRRRMPFAFRGNARTLSAISGDIQVWVYRVNVNEQPRGPSIEGMGDYGAWGVEQRSGVQGSINNSDTNSMRSTGTIDVDGTASGVVYKDNRRQGQVKVEPGVASASCSGPWYENLAEYGIDDDMTQDEMFASILQEAERDAYRAQCGREPPQMQQEVSRGRDAKAMFRERFEKRLAEEKAVRCKSEVELPTGRVLDDHTLKKKVEFPTRRVLDDQNLGALPQSPLRARWGAGAILYEDAWHKGQMLAEALAQGVDPSRNRLLVKWYNEALNLDARGKPDRIWATAGELQAAVQRVRPNIDFRIDKGDMRRYSGRAYVFDLPMNEVEGRMITTRYSYIENVDVDQQNRAVEAAKKNVNIWNEVVKAEKESLERSEGLERGREMVQDEQQQCWVIGERESHVLGRYRAMERAKLGMEDCGGHSEMPACTTQLHTVPRYPEVRIRFNEQLESNVVLQAVTDLVWSVSEVSAVTSDRFEEAATVRYGHYRTGETKTQQAWFAYTRAWCNVKVHAQVVRRLMTGVHGMEFRNRMMAMEAVEMMEMLLAIGDRLRKKVAVMRESMPNVVQGQISDTYDELEQIEEVVRVFLAYVMQSVGKQNAIPMRVRDGFDIGLGDEEDAIAIIENYDLDTSQETDEVQQQIYERNIAEIMANQRIDSSVIGYSYEEVVGEQPETSRRPVSRYKQVVDSRMDGLSEQDDDDSDAGTREGSSGVQNVWKQDRKQKKCGNQKRKSKKKAQKEKDERAAEIARRVIEEARREKEAKEQAADDNMSGSNGDGNNKNIIGMLRQVSERGANEGESQAEGRCEQVDESCKEKPREVLWYRFRLGLARAMTRLAWCVFPRDGKCDHEGSAVQSDEGVSLEGSDEGIEEGHRESVELEGQVQQCLVDERFAVAIPESGRRIFAVTATLGDELKCKLEWVTVVRTVDFNYEFTNMQFVKETTVYSGDDAQSREEQLVTGLVDGLLQFGNEIEDKEVVVNVEWRDLVGVLSNRDANDYPEQKERLSWWSRLLRTQVDPRMVWMANFDCTLAYVLTAVDQNLSDEVGQIFPVSHEIEEPLRSTAIVAVLQRHKGGESEKLTNQRNATNMNGCGVREVRSGVIGRELTNEECARVWTREAMESMGLEWREPEVEHGRKRRKDRWWHEFRIEGQPTTVQRKRFDGMGCDSVLVDVQVHGGVLGASVMTEKMIFDTGSTLSVLSDEAVMRLHEAGLVDVCRELLPSQVICVDFAGRKSDLSHVIELNLSCKGGPIITMPCCVGKNIKFSIMGINMIRMMYGDVQWLEMLEWAKENGFRERQQRRTGCGCRAAAASLWQRVVRLW